MACFVIAEIGINHNGNLEVAKQLIDAAKEAGANAVKFQCWDKDRFPNIEPLRMPGSSLIDLKRYAEGKGLVWFCTPFDNESIDFLAETGMKIWKVPSGKVIDIPYLTAIAEKNPEWVIMSLGQGYNKEKPTFEQVKAGIYCFATDTLKTLLYCESKYPALPEDIDFAEMVYFKDDEFPNTQIGFSDHSLSVILPVVAVARGATLIEKHITMDRHQEGPDHKASITPDEFKLMVAIIREAERCNSTYTKKDELARAREYLQKHIQTDGEGGYFDKGEKIIIELARAVSDQGDLSPEIIYLFGMYANYWGNNEMAAFSCAYAINLYRKRCQTAPQYILTTLTKLLKELKAQESEDDYIGITSRGFATAILHYRNEAMRFFSEGSHIRADHYIQRANAIKLPHASKTNDIDFLMEYISSEQIYSDSMKKCREDRKKHFVDGSKGGLGMEHYQWLTDINKIYLAKITAQLLDKCDHPVCLELGSHAGALMRLVKDRCLSSPFFIGIEPQPEAVNICNEKYPWITTVQGNHNDLKKFKDTHVSVLLLSCVLLLMETAEVGVVLEFARTNCKYLVIMDDICNFNGTIPLPRRYYLLHPYKALFDKYGFEVIEKHFPPEPNWAISGIMIAQNKNDR